MKNNKQFKKAFFNIKVSKSLDNKVLNSTVNKTHKKLGISKTIVTTLITLFLISTISVFAQNIIKSYFYNYTVDNGEKKELISVEGTVPVNQKSDFTCKKNLPLDELENKLKIKFLNNDKQKKNTFDDCEITWNKSKIGKIVLINNDIFDYSKDNEEIDLIIKNNPDYAKLHRLDTTRKFVNITVSLITDYATKNDIELFKKGFGIISSEYSDDMVENYHIKALDIDAYIINWSPIGQPNPKIYAIFIHNNIVYQIQGNSIEKSDILNLLENYK